MKRRILNWIGIPIMAGAIAFSVIQLTIPVVKADGCPDPSSVGCGCVFLYSTWEMQDGVPHGECHY